MRVSQQDKNFANTFTTPAMRSKYTMTAAFFLHIFVSWLFILLLHCLGAWKGKFSVKNRRMHTVPACPLAKDRVNFYPLWQTRHDISRLLRRDNILKPLRKRVENRTLIRKGREMAEREKMKTTLGNVPGRRIPSGCSVRGDRYPLLLFKHSGSWKYVQGEISESNKR